MTFNCVLITLIDANQQIMTFSNLIFAYFHFTKFGITVKIGPNMVITLIKTWNFFTYMLYIKLKRYGVNVRENALPPQEKQREFTK